MKIGILTHDRAESHGACLQHYAMTQYLQALGHEVHTLTYARDFGYASAGDRAKFSVSLRSIPFYFREYLLKQGFAYVWTMARKHLLLQRFNRRYFSYASHTDSGFDAVWSLQMGFNAVLFGHGIGCDRLIAYSPSFGQTDFAQIQYHGRLDDIREGLSRFQAISTRDLHTQQLVTRLTGQSPSINCDPALLYRFDRELSALPKRTAPAYIAVYAYNSDLNEPERVEAIRAYARSIGAQVYAVGGYHRWCDRQIACDPLELLAWFRDAEAVITDTFHGTIGAFLTRTPMAVYVRPTNRNKLSHLLTALQLEDRTITDSHPLYEVFSVPLHFDTLHASLQAFRSESGNWLKQALTEPYHREGL